jgi:hypothetical protein
MKSGVMKDQVDPVMTCVVVLVGTGAVAPEGHLWPAPEGVCLRTGRGLHPQGLLEEPWQAQLEKGGSVGP